MTRFLDTRPPGAQLFRTRGRVQWADIDLAGIMYFASYWRFAERAEMEFFRELGFPYDRLFERYDFWLPRVKVEAEYHHAALMDDWLDLQTHIEHVGNSSVRWRTVVVNERTGEAGATFTLTCACMDRATHKSKKLPAELREALLGALAVPT
ncbi:MAG TPA: thioesterase family protein [Candidatus Dormibacteraeota bacterium]|nr:thioesterase family protein [Candidatus Dormibacteraeota bacterium]